MSHNLCPAISPGPKMLTNRFGNKSFMQPMRRLSIALMRGSDFLFVGWGGAAASHTLFAFIFSLVLNVFLSCSHRVPSMFP